MHAAVNSGLVTIMYAPKTNSGTQVLDLHCLETKVFEGMGLWVSVPSLLSFNCQGCYLTDRHEL